MLDFTNIQLYSPAHALLRVYPNPAANLLNPAEHDALQVAHTLCVAEAAYNTANAAYTANLSLLDAALLSGLQLPPVVPGFAVYYGIDNGSGTYFAQTVTWRRFWLSLTPLDATQRGVAAEVVTISGHSNPIYNGTTTTIGLNQTVGTVYVRSDFTPIDTANEIADTHTLSTTIFSSWMLADARLDTDFSEHSSAIQLAFGDSFTLPLYVCKNPSGTVPVVTIVLQNIDTLATYNFASGLNRVLHAVPDVESTTRVLSYNITPPNSEYRLYELTIDNGQYLHTLPEGCYRLLLSASGQLWYSDAFHLRSTADTLSKLMRYRSDDNQMDFIYQDENNATLPNAWNQLRLPILIRDATQTHERQVYLRSDGTTLKLQERIGKQYTLETDYLPEPVHERIALALAHDYVELYDDTTQRWLPFVLSGDYEVEWPENQYALAPAKAELTLAQYKTVNSYC